jgi:hypothetical protein
MAVEVLPLHLLACLSPGVACCTAFLQVDWAMKSAVKYGELVATKPGASMDFLTFEKQNDCECNHTKHLSDLSKKSVGSFFGMFGIHTSGDCHN